MAKTIAQLHTEAQTIKNATTTGENTATRVGGTIDDVVDYLDEKNTEITTLNDVVFGYERSVNVPYNDTDTSNARSVKIDWHGTIKDGDVFSFVCDNGYKGTVYTAINSTTVDTIFADSVQSYSFTYDNGDGKWFRFMVKRNDDGVISLAEALAHSQFSLIRQERGGGVADKIPYINILFVGNSVSQDHAAYLPWLLKNTYGTDVKFRVCIAYKGGYTIDKYVTDIITGNENLDIFSVADNAQNWMNMNNYAWADIWDEYEYFDVISFQGYFNNGTSGAGYVEDTSSFSALIAEFKSRQNGHPFKLAYLMHQTYTNNTHTEAEAWTRIVGGAEFAIQNNPVSMLFACGAVTKLVNGQIPESTLTNDRTHNQQGFPCIMGAYVLMEVLARYVGLQSKIINNPLRINSTVETSLHIPGPNGTLQVGTDSQYSICQDAATQAVKWGDYLLTHNSGVIL